MNLIKNIKQEKNYNKNLDKTRQIFNAKKYKI